MPRHFGEVSYYVELKRYNTHWRVTDAQNRILFDAATEHGAGQVGVFQEKDKHAVIQRRVTLRGQTAEVYVLKLPEKRYAINNGCIYDSGRMVGRIYRIQQRIYLDVEREHMNDGLLAYLVSLP